MKTIINGINLTKEPSAFQFQGDVIRDWNNGLPIPADFNGHCLVCFKDGETRIFRTWVDGNSERNWIADSKMEIETTGRTSK